MITGKPYDIKYIDNTLDIRSKKTIMGEFEKKYFIDICFIICSSFFILFS